jgi:hypothetical protein
MKNLKISSRLYWVVGAALVEEMAAAATNHD